MSSSAPPSTPPSTPWNFNAGPGVLPASVLRQAASELEAYRGPFPQGTGTSVMCMSHRSREFEELIGAAREHCRRLLSVPDTHTVLFLHGGGTGAFASVPLNLAQRRDDTVSYLVTGHWSSLAAKEAAKYAAVEVLADARDERGGYTTIPPAEAWKQASPGSKYLHLCYNETQHGVAFPSLPPAALPLPPLVADMSSCFMSAPVDVSRFACIYAGAQKNVGPAGVTIYIVRKDLLKAGPSPLCPSVFDWQAFEKAGSMLNTPCTWSIYVMNLVFEWIQERGGLAAMEAAAIRKSQLVYAAIDASGGFYRTFVDQPFRSRQNIVFYICTSGVAGEQDRELQARFIAESEAAGFLGLAGHRNIGAMRASIYNGLEEEACVQLVKWMKEFQQRNQKK